MSASLRHSLLLARTRPAYAGATAVAARAFSASASTSYGAAAAASTSTSSSPTKLPMSWTEYLAMRKRRKQWSTLTTIPSSIGGFFGGAMWCANLDHDPSQPILGLDPMWVYSGTALGCLTLGYLIGPVIGNTIFGLTHPKFSRGNPSPLEVMDREFFHRIKARRSDPSRQSVNNPSPDFYGEKIVSLPTYRRWLKDQKVFDRKASHGVPGEE